MLDLERTGELEFEELQELEIKFAEDLERVFQGKQKEFGDHLRGMLFELWAQARGTKPAAVKELDELRKLKAEKTELRNLIGEEVKNQLPFLMEHLRSNLDNVMIAGIQQHLHNELHTPASPVFDDALATALFRVLRPGPGLEAVKSYGALDLNNTVSADVLPELPQYADTQADEVQRRLRKRLQHEGLLPPDDFHESGKWAPMYFNTKSGEQAAFHLESWQTRQSVTPQERIKVALAWDGAGRWRFPNPRS